MSVAHLLLPSPTTDNEKMKPFCNFWLFPTFEFQCIKCWFLLLGYGSSIFFMQLMEYFHFKKEFTVSTYSEIGMKKAQSFPSSSARLSLFSHPLLSDFFRQSNFGALNAGFYS